MLVRTTTAIRRSSWLPVVAVVALVACGSEVPTPHYVAQPASALVQVQTAPPPARVETVPARPQRGAVWLDGEWAWQGRKWAWRRGRWVMPPAGASYSPWTMTRDQNGGVWFAAGAWRSAHGEDVTEPDALATATASRSDVTDANGEKEETGRNLREPRKNRDAGASP
jgi:hypothetical protein